MQRLKLQMRGKERDNRASLMNDLFIQALLTSGHMTQHYLRPSLPCFILHTQVGQADEQQREVEILELESEIAKLEETVKQDLSLRL